MGDSLGHIKTAIKLLGASVSDIKQAHVYKTRAVGYTDQPDFMNTAIQGKTDLEPMELLAFVKKIEKDAGRTWSFRFGPRQIDIDIIFYDDQVMNAKDLTIPHPALIGRDFVLKPLCDLDPSLKDPNTGRTVKDLLDSLGPASRSIISTA
jgi:2-amino-4-hydroxy-6-hydroxymethyldihydropteridine diphosphokinase